MNFQASDHRALNPKHKKADDKLEPAQKTAPSTQIDNTADQTGHTSSAKQIKNEAAQPQKGAPSNRSLDENSSKPGLWRRSSVSTYILRL